MTDTYSTQDRNTNWLPMSKKHFFLPAAYTHTAQHTAHAEHIAVSNQNIIQSK